MPHEITKTLKQPVGADRPFPWRCHRCFQDAVSAHTISYEAKVQHEGHLHTVTIPCLQLPICEACGQKVFTEKVDDQINATLRQHLHLLAPAEIGGMMDRLGMSLVEFAGRLGVEEASLDQWLSGTQIQSRAMDNLIRVFFQFPEVRTVLKGPFLPELPQQSGVAS